MSTAQGNNNNNNNVHVCAQCGAKPASLLRCGGCKQVYYCNQDHQKQHWKSHKVQCKKSTEGGGGGKEVSKEAAKPQSQSSSKKTEDLPDVSEQPFPFTEGVLECVGAFLSHKQTLEQMIYNLGGINTLFGLFLNDEWPSAFQQLIDVVFSQEQHTATLSSPATLPYLKAGLIGPRASPRLQSRTLKGLALWLRTERGRTILEASPLYGCFVQLVGSAEVEVSQKAAEISVILAQTETGAAKLLRYATKCIAEKPQDNTHALRLVSVTVDAALHRPGSPMMKQLVVGGILSKTLSLMEAAGDDVLLQVNFLELLAKMASHPNKEGCEIMLKEGAIVRVLGACAHAEQQGMGGFLAAGALDVIYKFAKTANEVGIQNWFELTSPSSSSSSSSSSSLSLVNFLNSQLQSNEDKLQCSATLVLGSIAGSVRGLHFLAPGFDPKASKQDLGLLAFLPQYARDVNRALSCAALSSVAELLKPLYNDEWATALQKAVVDAVPGQRTSAAAFLASLLTQPFPESRFAVLGVLSALVPHPWGLEILVGAGASGGLLEWLLDRRTETTKEGAEMKYDVLCKLDAHPQLDSFLSSSGSSTAPSVLRDSVTAFVKQGAFFAATAGLDRSNYQPQVKGPTTQRR